MELSEAVVLIVVAAAIGALCWIWMVRSRASQGRMEANQQEMNSLLREQNELLRKFISRP